MRLDPWKLAALVLIIACVDEVVRPGVAHAPGSEVSALQPADHAVPPALEPTDDDAASPAALRDE